MIIKGKYCDIDVKIDEIEKTAEDQLKTISNLLIFKGTHIKVMPDTHAGNGCVIGFTMPLTNFVIPNLIGVDIGCGVSAYKLDLEVIDLSKLDNFIRENIPYGFNINEKENIEQNRELYQEVAESLNLDKDKVLRSLGSLGGGNHFIEMGRGQDNKLWVFLHSGSRNFGLKIANHYQNLAKEFITTSPLEISKDLAYLLTSHRESSTHAASYIIDMRVAQQYASQNRSIMMNKIVKYLEVPVLDQIESVHNYISLEDKIIRKGAVSANKGQKIVIPFNMRDGVLIAEGKGNLDWNNSAPHGAGRIFSRGDAKRNLKVEDFKEQMQGIFSTCVSKETLDESPMVYKPYLTILDSIKDTVEIKQIVKPIYNFKAI